MIRHLTLVSAVAVVFASYLACKPKAVDDQRSGDPSTLSAEAASSLASATDDGSGAEASAPPPPFNDVESGPATGGAVALTFTGPATVKTDACSTVLVVTSVDGQNNPLNIDGTQDTPLTISGLGSAELFLESTCESPFPAPFMGAQSSSATFFLKDAKAETLTLTVAASGPAVVLKPASVPVKIGP